MPRLVALALFLLAACGTEETAPASGPPAEAASVAAPADTSGVWVDVPGGRTTIGSEDGLPQEQPTFEADVPPFGLMRSPVTVAQFRAFVERTGYVTEAERFGSGTVLTQTGWHLVPGASWHHALGPDGPPAPDDHPVTQVSWNDAAAYCEAAGGRLPTEVEWEHAARNARDDRRPYAWGDSLVTHDHDGSHERHEAEAHYHANTWTGTFPTRNTAADGYQLTSPVGAFGETDLGLTDLGGNVWEWTGSWYRPYGERDQPFTPTPASERVQRGGSFLCHPSYCHGYRVSARSHATPESSLFHVGFRCARGAG
ncbi:MAG: formylglycine-generating enzyme family protein [Rubricoccaceae bacterium]|nr:formylglycine-generating enzyme family protein [Rubricoccaceae bacterium]